jgi:hypothetical protein
VLASRRHEAGQERASPRNAIGLVSDIGGAVAAVSMLAAVAASATGTVAGLANDESGIAMLGLGSLGGLAIGAACTYGILARRASSPEVQQGYRWVRATYTYTIDPNDVHVHQQVADIEIKAIRDGVRTFSNQYRWSGSGDEDGPVVTSPGHSLSGPIRRSLAWRTYDVHLDPPLRKGETTTISVTQHLHDRDERFEPFLAKTVHEATVHLRLRVELPIDLLPDRAWRITRLGAGPHGRERSRTLVKPILDGTHALLEWEVARPAVGKDYQLYWDYAESRSIYEMAEERSQPQ